MPLKNENSSASNTHDPNNKVFLPNFEVLFFSLKTRKMPKILFYLILRKKN